MKTSPRRSMRGAGWGCLFLLAFLSSAWGQGMGRPLYVGNVLPALDQFGRPFSGSHQPEEAPARSRVELRLATNGLRLPPSSEGEAHPFNPLLTPESVGGIGMNTFVTDAGVFWMVFERRPTAGTKLFARVFNAPTVEEASFYIDSNVVETRATDYALVLTFNGVAKELDSSIDPETGLSRSWLKFLGGDPNRDSDRDGLSDYEEFLAGTDPDDPKSVLAFSDIRRHEPGDPRTPARPAEGWVTPVRVAWQSVPGKHYRLQFAESLLDGYTFIDIEGGAITAGNGETELELWVDLEDDRIGVFRVKLGLPEE